MAVLKGMSGDLEGQVFDLTEAQTTIGRHETNKIPLNHLSVSSFHCCIDKDGEKYTLRDLDSTNGTRVEGQKIKMRRLVAGNVVQIGGLEFMFEGATANAAGIAPVTVRTSKPEPGAATAADSSSTGRSDFKSAGNFRTKMLWIVIAVAAVIAIIGAIFFFINLSHLE
jgi:pSer/pThr/pTyr-binding forkhead associated (FHA) protein